MYISSGNLLNSWLWQREKIQANIMAGQPPPERTPLEIKSFDYKALRETNG